MAFAESMTEPPPTASTQSTFDDVGAVPVTDNLNLSLMNTIRAEAPRVLADPDNYDARARRRWA